MRDHDAAAGRDHAAAPDGERGAGARNAARPRRLAAALNAAGLSLLFIAVYGACNTITAQRADVGLWHYEWERSIPFVPLMIVPYMSIDAFFVAAPFLCSTRAELRTLRRRIVLGIVLAGACFLLLPLRMAEARPQPEGWTGAIFAFLHGFDQPHNLFPSLHITLRTILAATYARHTRGWLHGLVQAWFSLIGVSTLLTYQHHVADVVGGFVLAAFCFFLVREEPLGAGAMTNRRVGAFYLAGASACGALAFVRWPWTAWLLWPAVALVFSATAYLGLGAAVFGKRRGVLPWSTRLVLAPSLLGQRLSRWYYRRGCAAWNEVTPRVWIGAALSAREARKLVAAGATAVLDLTAEFSEPRATRALVYRNVPVVDLAGPSPAQLEEAVAFVARHASDGVVFVHCKIGYSRSATVVAAYLLATGQAATIDEALAVIRRARPAVVFRPEVLTALRGYAARLRPCAAGGEPARAVTA